MAQQTSLLGDETPLVSGWQNTVVNQPVSAGQTNVGFQNLTIYQGNSSAAEHPAISRQPTVATEQIAQAQTPQPVITHPVAPSRPEDLTRMAPNDSPSLWWNESVAGPLLHRTDWVTFDLETVLLDTLRHSPRIKSVTHQASSALERIVQQDAAFDSTLLFSGTGGRTNDPVGNTLTTGGPSRLRDETASARAGLTKNGRRGTQVGLTQQVGIKSSNSTFFVPEDQGDAKLSLSLTQPLLDRAGQVYNERLLTQARIDSRVTWQDMRGDVERRIADVMTAYWRLYEVRCHLLQQQQLLQRSKKIQATIIGRNGFDGSRIELAKAKQRVARRTDLLVTLDAEVLKRQTRLATLIGAEELSGASARLELIPLETPVFPDQQWELRDVVLQALENRPEVKAATSELEAAALAIRVTRTELVPQLNAVINASLASLNGENRFGESFLDQFSGIGPGFSAGLQYEMPYGRRAARSRVREAQHQYRQRAESLRETVQETQFEAESALIDLQRTSRQHQTKRDVLRTAIEEETIVTRRWELMGSEGGRAGTVLENLLDAQQRRTDAEREYVSAQTEYMTALIALQRAMGTLLRYEGINTVRSGGDIQFAKQEQKSQFGRSAPVAQPTEALVPPEAAVVSPEAAVHPPAEHGTTTNHLGTSQLNASANNQAASHPIRQRIPSYARFEPKSVPTPSVPTPSMQTPFMPTPPQTVTQTINTQEAKR
jgi:outer membrane protein TolC